MLIPLFSGNILQTACFIFRMVSCYPPTEVFLYSMGYPLIEAGKFPSEMSLTKISTLINHIMQK